VHKFLNILKKHPLLWNIIVLGQLDMAELEFNSWMQRTDSCFVYHDYRLTDEFSFEKVELFLFPDRFIMYLITDSNAFYTDRDKYFGMSDSELSYGHTTDASGGTEIRYDSSPKYFYPIKDGIKGSFSIGYNPMGKCAVRASRYFD
jgi:hypothetical protein